MHILYDKYDYGVPNFLNFDRFIKLGKFDSNY